MHPEEKILAAYLLDLAADRFCNHSCNDLLLSDIFSNEDTVLGLYARYEEDEDVVFDEDGDVKQLYLNDASAMNMVAARLREEARMEGWAE
jgi:hypothetical protein